MMEKRWGENNHHPLQCKIQMENYYRYCWCESIEIEHIHSLYYTHISTWNHSKWLVKYADGLKCIWKRAMIQHDLSSMHCNQTHSVHIVPISNQNDLIHIASTLSDPLHFGTMWKSFCNSANLLKTDRAWPFSGKSISRIKAQFQIWLFSMHKTSW